MFFFFNFKLNYSNFQFKASFMNFLNISGLIKNSREAIHEQSIDFIIEFLGAVRALAG